MKFEMIFSTSIKQIGNKASETKVRLLDLNTEKRWFNGSNMTHTVFHDLTMITRKLNLAIDLAKNRYMTLSI